MKRLLCGTLAACSMLATAQAADCAFANRQTRTMAGCLMYINQDDTVRIPNYISPFDTVDDISGAMSIATTDEPSYMAAYAVILKDGSLLTWGNNEYYQLGRSDSTAYPQKILSDIVSVSCGTVHMLAVKTDNTLWGWGDNSSNQLSNLYNTQTPTLLMTDVQDAVACSISSMAIKTDGSLWIWGNGNKNYGEAPDGVCYGSTPTKVMDHVIAASGGDTFFVAVKDDYTLWSWGDNNLGQLGNGTYNSSVTPVQIMSNVKSVCAGKDFALALTNNGDVYRWGAVNGHEVEGGNLPRKIADHVVSISAEYLRCSALKSDGTVLRWDGDELIDNVENIKLPERIYGKPSTWAQAEVNEALNLQLVPDNLADKYQQSITRQEFCHLAVNMLEQKTGKNILALTQEQNVSVNYNAFSDCDDADVAVINALGIVNGYGNGKFGPNNQITREQAATMLMKTAKVLGLIVPNSTSITFNDMSHVSNWAKEGVQFITACQTGNASVMNGTSSGVFTPKGNYSREQAIITFKRLYQVC